MGERLRISLYDFGYGTHEYARLFREKGCEVSIIDSSEDISSIAGNSDIVITPSSSHVIQVRQANNRAVIIGVGEGKWYSVGANAFIDRSDQISSTWVSRLLAIPGVKDGSLYPGRSLMDESPFGIPSHILVQMSEYPETYRGIDPHRLSDATRALEKLL